MRRREVGSDFVEVGGGGLDDGAEMGVKGEAGVQDNAKVAYRGRE